MELIGNWFCQIQYSPPPLPPIQSTVGRHKGIWSLLDSGRFRTGLLSSGIVYTIQETDINGILMQNMDEHLITNRLHVRIYSVSRFHACHLHRYIVLLLSIRLPKSKGIASVSIFALHIYQYISIQTDFMIETCAYS